MNIKITAASTCDFSPELCRRLGVTLAPLHVVKGGQSYRDGVNITPQDIFAHVDAGGELCTTTAVSVGEYLDLFEPLSKMHDAVVHITIGSEFSSCYQNACLAADELPNVVVIDSCNLSNGQGQIVAEACRLAQDCRDVSALCDELRDLTGRIETSLLLNRLDYMVKGGRCSSVMALGANLLRLKPSIEVVDGRMRVARKYRGDYAKCLGEYVQDRLAGRSDIETARIFAPHTAMPPATLAAFHKAVARAGKFGEIIHEHAGCTVCCHCGPSTVGLMLIRKK